MDPSEEAVEAVDDRSPLSLFEHFFSFLHNFLVLFYKIFLWVRDSASHKGRMKSKDLATGHFLGQGCSGIFYETTWSRSQDSTVKLARKDFPGVKGGIFEREVIRMFEVSNHPNVVKTLGWTVDKRSCSLVMEYVRDDLSSIMRRKKEAQRGKANQPGVGASLAIFQLHEAMDIALQIAVGVEYLHNNRVTHGDLKPNNVLIGSGKEGRLLVKVADFGLIETKRRSTLISQRALCFRMIEWSAPELFEDYFRSHSEDLDYLWAESPTGSDTGAPSTSNIDDCPKIWIEKVDSYSFALTCACILGGQIRDAKLGSTELRRQICCGLRPKLPSECPKTLRSLISSCWDSNPERRPTFSFIRNRLQEIIQEQSMLEVESYGLFTDQLDVKKEMIKDHIKSGEPLSQVSEGFRTIENVTKFSGNAASEVATVSSEKMKLVVSEKSEDKSESLPDYLKIDTASVEIMGSVHKPERLSNRDSKVTHGSTLVQRGTYFGCDCAIKVFKSGDRSEQLKEVRALMELQYPHVVQLLGFAQDEKQCMILMELMDNDLRHFMSPRSSNGKRPFSRKEEMDIITQIAKGMYYLHEQQYVHGELTCSNILVKQIGDHIDVKICDFRSSMKLGAWDPVSLKGRSMKNPSQWTAPEVQKHAEVEPTHELLKKTDVYSFGMICYEVLTGKFPFHSVHGGELMRRIESGDLRQELPDELDLDGRLRRLIESCWDREPNLRPKFEDICILLDSQRAETNMSSRMRKYMSILGLSPPFMRLEGREERTDHPPEFLSMWEDTWYGDVPDVATYNADSLPFPEFVRIDPRHLTKGRLIARGGYTDVLEVTWMRCKIALAVFCIRSLSEVEAKLKHAVELRHPCIVRSMGALFNPRFAIMMELMACDLRQLIDSRRSQNKVGSVASAEQLRPLPFHDGPFDIHEVLHIINRIALGMVYLHSRGVAHRDLNSFSVLVPDLVGCLDVKIDTFFSVIIDEASSKMRSEGTGFWRAPEILLSMWETRSSKTEFFYDLKAADVYSFAMTCYEVVTGKVPYEDQRREEGFEEVRRKVIAGTLRPELPGKLDPSLRRLIEDCWDADPARRPTFSTICERLQKIRMAVKKWVISWG
ncbi:hypothetical protein M758_12G184200 [Ceratodon purpureus]|nr:hypothetical protein M758_12G184200 [Ceratodon purpureus]